jgi:hypothetical protein
MKKNILFLVTILIALALPGCKQEEEPQRKLIITGIDSQYNNLDAKITLTQGFSQKASGAAKVSGGQVTFALVGEDGNPFIDGGLLPYSATLTIFGASGTSAGAYIGVTPAVVITQETTSVEFSKFTGTGGGV